MKPGRPDAVELCRRYLFADAKDFRDQVCSADFEKIIRCRAMYMWMVEQPSSKDAEFVQETCARFQVSRPTAYSDLAVIKTLLPELSKTADKFHRWRFIEMILETYAIAKTKGDTRTMEKAAADYARYNRIDVEREEIDLAAIAPQPFVPTMDPRVLGIEPMPDLKERKRALIEKYSREVADIQDIGFEEIDLADITDISGIADKPLTP